MKNLTSFCGKLSESFPQNADEVEALSSIYGEEWCVIDESSRNYCIQVTDDKDPVKLKLCIQVHFPENYPSASPPHYQLDAPWLRGLERQQLESSLADIYCENMGNSIIFLWVEKIREFLQKAVENLDRSGKTVQSSDGRCLNLTQETDDDIDEFDLSFSDDGSSLSDDHSDNMDSDWECPKVFHGTPITDRRSTFQAHYAQVFHKKQVKMVLETLTENKKIANATHNIMAYRICQRDSVSLMIQGCDDDGETHAGSRMLHLMKILDVQNVMVVVSRWYGGILLGPDRFKHINNCTRQILLENGCIKEKEDKKGPKMKKGKLK